MARFSNSELIEALTDTAIALTGKGIDYQPDPNSKNKRCIGEAVHPITGVRGEVVLGDSAVIIQTWDGNPFSLTFAAIDRFLRRQKSRNGDDDQPDLNPVKPSAAHLRNLKEVREQAIDAASKFIREVMPEHFRYHPEVASAVTVTRQVGTAIHDAFATHMPVVEVGHSGIRMVDSVLPAAGLDEKYRLAMLAVYGVPVIEEGRRTIRPCRIVARGISDKKWQFEGRVTMAFDSKVNSYPAIRSMPELAYPMAAWAYADKTSRLNEARRRNGGMRYVVEALAKAITVAELCGEDVLALNDLSDFKRLADNVEAQQAVLHGCTSGLCVVMDAPSNRNEASVHAMAAKLELSLKQTAKSMGLTIDILVRICRKDSIDDVIIRDLDLANAHVEELGRKWAPVKNLRERSVVRYILDQTYDVPHSARVGAELETPELTVEGAATSFREGLAKRAIALNSPQSQAESIDDVASLRGLKIPTAGRVYLRDISGTGTGKSAETAELLLEAACGVRTCDFHELAGQHVTVYTSTGYDTLPASLIIESQREESNVLLARGRTNVDWAVSENKAGVQVFKRKAEVGLGEKVIALVPANCENFDQYVEARSEDWSKGSAYCTNCPKRKSCSYVATKARMVSGDVPPIIATSNSNRHYVLSYIQTANANSNAGISLFYIDDDLNLEGDMSIVVANDLPPVVSLNVAGVSTEPYIPGHIKSALETYYADEQAKARPRNVHTGSFRLHGDTKMAMDVLEAAIRVARTMSENVSHALSTRTAVSDSSAMLVALFPNLHLVPAKIIEGILKYLDTMKQTGRVSPLALPVLSAVEFKLVEKFCKSHVALWANAETEAALMEGLRGLLEAGHPSGWLRPDGCVNLLEVTQETRAEAYEYYFRSPDKKLENMGAELPVPAAQVEVKSKVQISKNSMVRLDNKACASAIKASRGGWAYLTFANRYKLMETLREHVTLQLLGRHKKAPLLRLRPDYTQLEKVLRLNKVPDAAKCIQFLKAVINPNYAKLYYPSIRVLAGHPTSYFEWVDGECVRVDGYQFAKVEVQFAISKSCYYDVPEIAATLQLSADEPWDTYRIHGKKPDLVFQRTQRQDVRKPVVLRVHSRISETADSVAVGRVVAAALDYAQSTGIDVPEVPSVATFTSKAAKDGHIKASGDGDGTLLSPYRKQLFGDEVGSNHLYLAGTNIAFVMSRRNINLTVANGLQGDTHCRQHLATNIIKPLEGGDGFINFDGVQTIDGQEPLAISVTENLSNVYKSIIQTDQAFGRLRANQRPNEPTVCVVTQDVFFPVDKYEIIDIPAEVTQFSSETVDVANTIKTAELVERIEEVGEEELTETGWVSKLAGAGIGKDWLVENLFYYVENRKKGARYTAKALMKAVADLRDYYTSGIRPSLASFVSLLGNMSLSQVKQQVASVVQRLYGGGAVLAT